MKVTALAGGVGGAKLADGLYRCLSPNDLKIIVNTGDDFIHFGLSISPDLDTVCYTLAGIANPSVGWGLQEESFQVINALSKLNAPAWFKLGDCDLATHLERTRRLGCGVSLSTITRDFCNYWGVSCEIMPMTDKPVRTMLKTKEHGILPFQEYFVLHHCEPTVEKIIFEGIHDATPAPSVMESIRSCDLIIICPSNPWVSIWPIISIPGVKNEIIKKKVIAISPLIGGKTIKGPAAKMYQEMGFEPSNLTIANHYQDFLTGLVIDTSDQENGEELSRCGIIPFVTDIIMKDLPDRKRLANEVLLFAKKLLST